MVSILLSSRCRVSAISVAWLWRRAQSSIRCADIAVKVMNTPIVLLDEQIVAKNIERMQTIASKNQVSIRPHIKTHKSIELAKRQLTSGSVGVTCSKPEEACVFLKAGMNTLLAYPVMHAEKAQKIIQQAVESVTLCGLTMIADSVVGVRVLINVLNKLSLPSDDKLKVMIKIDVGLHRCGLNVHDTESVFASELQAILMEISTHPQLCFHGILSHAGNAYGAMNKAECLSMANSESAQMRAVKQAIVSMGYICPIVSVGCTLTEWVRTDFDGIDEIRPGNYIFNDSKPLQLDLIQPEDIALTVLATVVSVNSEYVLIDAGSKVMSSDKGAHGTAGTTGHGSVWKVGNIFDMESHMVITPPAAHSSTTMDRSVQQMMSDILRPVTVNDLARSVTLDKLSEEHGWINVSQSAVARSLRRGDLVRVLPNHSCVVANLTDEYMIFNNPEGSCVGDTTVRKLKVDARGAVH